MLKRFNLIFAGMVFLLFGQTTVQTGFAQCGIYFKTRYQSTLTSDLSDYQVEDWTSDGKADFWKFQLNPNTSMQDIYIYSNNGNGGFDWNNPIISPTTIPVINPNLDSYQLIDFNNDGKKDILFSQGQTTHKIYLNNGNNSFTALASNTFNDESNNPLIQSIGFIDVNGDNLLDWVRVNSIPGQGQSLNYRLGSANGLFGARVHIIFTSGQTNNIIGDFNGDGRKDIALGGNPARLEVVLNNGNGTFTSVINTLVVRSGNTIMKDFDNDGKDDIIVTYQGGTVDPPYTRYVTFYKSLGNGNFTQNNLPVFQIPGPPAPNAASIVTADFNGDNSPDILELGKTFYSIHLNNGAGTFSRTDYLNKLGEPQDLIFAQFNGDNKTDLFVKSNSAASLKNIFDEQIILIKYNQCAPSGETKRANFNGDLLPDLVTWNPNTGNWRVGLLGAFAVGTPASIQSFNWGTSGDIPALGDYDGDGKTDYSVYRPNEGNWYIFLSSTSSWAVFRFGLPGDVPVPSDYDGGGKTDIAVFRPSDGNWYLWFSEAQQFAAVHFGANGDKPVAADYYGDGKTDIAVYRPSEGNWYYLKSSDLNYSVIHWGISTDKPVPADYDGDGRSDLTVYRDGDWYILRSSNNSFNLIHFGTATDFPIPFYYNSDFAELMVYRATNNFWYHYPSTPPIYQGISFGQSQYTPIYFGLPNN